MTLDLKFNLHFSYLGFYIHDSMETIIERFNKQNNNHHRLMDATSAIKVTHACSTSLVIFKLSGIWLSRHLPFS